MREMPSVPLVPLRQREIEFRGKLSRPPTCPTTRVMCLLTAYAMRSGWIAAGGTSAWNAGAAISVIILL
jgi:hypothetical protein